jgi:hypothetical protein
MVYNMERCLNRSTSATTAIEYTHNENRHVTTYFTIGKRRERGEEEFGPLLLRDKTSERYVPCSINLKPPRGRPVDEKDRHELVAG